MHFEECTRFPHSRKADIITMELTNENQQEKRRACKQEQCTSKRSVVEFDATRP